MATEQVFAVFPYLRTRERVAIRGIEFRSSRDLADLQDDARKHLTTLCEMFFLQDGVRIVEMTCACLELPEDTERRQMWLRLLDETRLLVGYLYSTPDTSGSVFFSSEDTSLFTFRLGDTAFHPGMVSTSLVWQDKLHQDRVIRVDSKIPPQDMLTPGYVATRDCNVHFWVAEGSRIYPEVPFVRLNLSQNLSSNINMFLSHAHNWALEQLYSLPYQPMPEVSSRVFVAIDWYLRSCRETIAEPEAIVDLAIALESVLGLRPGEGVTERFADAVLTLLGPVPRLDSWLKQFYNARSKAVHEGIPHDTVFYATNSEDMKRKQGREDAIAHRSLLAYGRHIFRLCLNNILSGIALTERVGLAELFIHNKERIEAIFKALNEKDALPVKRLLNSSRYVFALKEFSTDIMEPLVEVKAALGAARLILQVYKDTNLGLPSEAVSAIDAVLVASTAKASVQLKRIEECLACLRERRRENRNPHEMHLHDTVIVFLDYVTQSGFKLRTYVAEQDMASPQSGATEDT